MKKQKKLKKEKLKEIKLPMKFNVGTLNYEPRLPLKKSHNKKIPLKNKIKWIFIVILIMILIILAYVSISFILKWNANV